MGSQRTQFLMFVWWLGLIIQEAKYGTAAESDDATENISLDVTIPLQALVRNSQVHIPGGDTKVMIGPSNRISFHLVDPVNILVGCIAGLHRPCAFHS